MKPTAVGNMGEQLAREILLSEGYSIIAENYRCRAGEIDIIAYDQDTLVFIEVKVRRDLSEAMQAVDQRKKVRLVRAASWYLAEHHLDSTWCRFDVVALAYSGESFCYQLIRDAF